MGTSRKEKILDIIREYEEEVIKTHNKAFADAFAAYQSADPVTRRLDPRVNAFSRAHMGIGFVTQYFIIPESFLNLLEVWVFLNEQGFKISKSKFYLHAKKGLISFEKDHRITVIEVLAYTVRSGLNIELTYQIVQNCRVVPRGDSV